MIVIRNEEQHALPFCSLIEQRATTACESSNISGRLEPLAIMKKGRVGIGMRALLSFHIIQNSKVQLNATVRGRIYLPIYVVGTTFYV